MSKIREGITVDVNIKKRAGSHQGLAFIVNNEDLMPDKMASHQYLRFSSHLLKIPMWHPFSHGLIVQ